MDCAWITFVAFTRSCSWASPAAERAREPAAEAEPARRPPLRLDQRVGVRQSLAPGRDEPFSGDASLVDIAQDRVLGIKHSGEPDVLDFIRKSDAEERKLDDRHDEEHHPHPGVPEGLGQFLFYESEKVRFMAQGPS